MKFTVQLTKAEAQSLCKRAKGYRSVSGRVVVDDLGATINWPHGIRKSKPRRSAEAKLLAALDAALNPDPPER